MRPGYEQHFKKKAQVAKGNSPQPRKSPRQNMPLPVRKKKPFPVLPVFGATLGMLFGLWAMFNVEKVDRFLEMIEVSAVTPSSAQTKGSEKASKQKGKKEEVIADAEQVDSSPSSKEKESWTPEELALFRKLDERKRQLDMREEELNKMEAELQKQKQVLEARMNELDQTRRKIAGQLEERVAVDQERVQKLVDVYSNMKPANAAQVFEKLDEDLAVEVLGNMKKKSAADILNLLPPEKAQKLSEKYTGYTRR